MAYAYNHTKITVFDSSSNCESMNYSNWYGLWTRCWNVVITNLSKFRGTKERIFILRKEKCITVNFIISMLQKWCELGFRPPLCSAEWLKICIFSSCNKQQFAEVTDVQGHSQIIILIKMHFATTDIIRGSWTFPKTIGPNTNLRIRDVGPLLLRDIYVGACIWCYWGHRIKVYFQPSSVLFFSSLCFLFPCGAYGLGVNCITSGDFFFSSRVGMLWLPLFCNYRH